MSQTEHPAITITKGFWIAVHGATIAHKLNCRYDGIQHGHGPHPDTMQFTCNVTGSTTYGNSFEEVKEKLETMRREFNV